MTRFHIALWLSAVSLWAQETSSRTDRWRQDVDFFADTVQRTHPNPFTRISREDFTAAVDELKGRVQDLPDYQILGAIMRITSRIGDAHTSVNLASTGQIRSYPVQFRWFPDGIYVVAAGGPAIPALGKKLIAIDGRSASEAFDRIRTIFPYENEYWAHLRGAEYLSGAELLHAAGVTNERASAVFEFEGDLKIMLTPGVAASVAFPRKASPHRPLYLLHTGLFYWFDHLADARALYVKYDVCADDPALPAADFGRQVVEFLKDRPFERVIVDLRNNSGGDSSILERIAGPVNEAAAKGEIPRPQAVYAIIGRQTFSSGMLNAIDLKRQGAILVGEPTGGIPNGFGEVRSFTLPNAGWRFQVSTRLFQIPGFTGMDALLPDLPVEATIQDLAAERDPYLDAIVSR